MAGKYYWCDYPTDDAGGKCRKPGRLMPHGGLQLCEAHAARLPFWPTDSEPAEVVKPDEAAPPRQQDTPLRFKNIRRGCVVVCDGDTHTYSRMRRWSKPEQTFVGTSWCWCERATPEQLARWQEAEA